MEDKIIGIIVFCLLWGTFGIALVIIFSKLGMY